MKVGTIQKDVNLETKGSIGLIEGQMGCGKTETLLNLVRRQILGDQGILLGFPTVDHESFYRLSYWMDRAGQDDPLIYDVGREQPYASARLLDDDCPDGLVADFVIEDASGNDIFRENGRAILDVLLNSKNIRSLSELHSWLQVDRIQKDPDLRKTSIVQKLLGTTEQADGFLQSLKNILPFGQSNSGDASVTEQNTEFILNTIKQSPVLQAGRSVFSGEDAPSILDHLQDGRMVILTDSSRMNDSSSINRERLYRLISIVLHQLGSIPIDHPVFVGLEGIDRSPYSGLDWMNRGTNILRTNLSTGLVFTAQWLDRDNFEPERLDWLLGMKQNRLETGPRTELDTVGEAYLEYPSSNDKSPIGPVQLDRPPSIDSVPDDHYLQEAS